MTHRGAPFHLLLQLNAFTIPGSGRGLVASAGIAKGEDLLSIPLQLVVTPAAAAQRSCLRDLLEASPLPAWSVLALWLAEQRAVGSAGEWWPYVRLLPEQTGGVLEWGDEQVAWLAGSQQHAGAAEIRRAADASWQELQPLLAAAEAAGLAPAPDAFSRAALRRAFSVLLSRLVRLPGLGDTEALLPWADLLNHGCSAASCLDWSSSATAVVLRAERRYRAGEQLLISYGQKTSGELLLRWLRRRRAGTWVNHSPAAVFVLSPHPACHSCSCRSYGFCPEPGSNPHDGCLLRLQLHDTGAPLQWKTAALERRGLAASQLFPLRMQAAPVEVVRFAAFAAAEVDSSDAAERLAAQLFGEGAIPSLALQAAALQAVVKACKAALAAYPRAFDVDRAELERLRDEAAAGGEEDEGRRRRRHVLQVLVYERQVLNRTVFVMQQELKDLQRMLRQ
jgi:hypothetical protein